MMKRAARSGYKPPALDSLKAVANASLFLAGARSLEAETPDSIAHRYRLSAKRAEYMLTVARQKRGAR